MRPMHLEDEQIQRLLHGELDAATGEAAVRHSEACAECKQRLVEARREEEWIFESLLRMDHAAPSLDAETVAAHTRGGVATGKGAPGSGAARGGGVRATHEVAPGLARWAAGILLALAAVGVAYAAPGSPLPGWVSRVAGWIDGPAPRPEHVVSPTPAKPASAGIAIAPREHFVIRFATTQAQGDVAVSLTGGAEITVRALNGIAAFTTDIDRLTIENAGSDANYEIDVPRDARWVEIRVGQRRMLLKRGGEIVADAEPDARGRYVLPLALHAR